jgi:hypothetical protein
MPSGKRNLRAHCGIGLGVALCLAFALFQPKATAVQTQSSGPRARQEVIGRIAGDDVSVTGEVSFERQNGRTTALLASGSEVKLHSGQAKVDLPGVGDIILCGPADLSIVKSGSAITIALNYGQAHLQVTGAAQLTIYTPLLIITPEAIGDRDRDLTIGLEQSGDLCITAVSGATRIQEQFSAESLIIPQGTNVQIERGELRSLSGSRKCSCELLVSQSSTETQIQLNPPTHTVPVVPPAQKSDEPPNQPIYRIDVPLIFNASSASPAGPSPEALLIIRQSVSDPATAFRGVVRPELPAPAAEASRANSTSVSHNSKLHFFARLFRFFRRQKATPGAQSAATYP